MNMFRGEIDVAHAHLIDGLVRAFKPTRILELGWGGGRSHNAIMTAAAFNDNQPEYTLVDNWSQEGQQPPDVQASVQLHTMNHITKTRAKNTLSHFGVVTSSEQDFIRILLQQNKATFEFIMSDADHEHTHQWCADVYHKLLTSPGILIYHDISTGYENLKTIKPVLQSVGGLCMEFNRKTREDEECQRGLLVVYKP